MIVKHLSLTNFKKHSQLDVNFESKTNLICGGNYKGKSTVLQAILVGLYGNACAPGDVKDLIRRGSSNFKITLTLSSGLIICRTATDSWVSRAEGAEPFARGHTAVNKALADEIGLSRDVFMKVFTSEQGSPQQLLEMEGMKLQRFIETCIGIEELDQVTKAANKKVDESKVRAGLYANNVLSPETEGDLRNQADTLKLQQLSDSRELEINRQLLQRVNESIKDAEQRMHEANLIKSKQEGAAKLLAMMEGLVHREPESTDALTEVLGHLGLLRDQHRENARLSKELADCQSELDAKRARVVTDIPKLISFDSEESEVRRLEELVREKISEESRAVELVTSAVCPTCKRPHHAKFSIEKAKQDLEVIRATLKADKDRWFDARETLSAIQSKNQKAKALMDANQRIEDSCEALKDRIARLQAKVVPGLTGSLEATNAEIRRINDELTELVAQNKVVHLDNQKLATLQKGLKDLGEVPAEQVDVPAIQQEVSSLFKQAKSIQDTNIILLTNENRTTAELQRVQAALKQHDEAVVQFLEANAVATRFKAVSNALANSRTETIAQAMTIIFQVTTEFVKAATDGDISEVFLQYGVDIKYREGDSVFGRWSASGAQKTLMGLGLRLGLSMVLQSGFKGFIFDEISADMSAEISMRCMMTLDSLAEQVLFVSHRPMDIASNCIDLGN